MKLKKAKLFILFLFVGVAFSYSQTGIQGSYIIPSGEIKAKMKPCLGIGAFHKAESPFDDFRFFFNLQYHSFKPKSDPVEVINNDPFSSYTEYRSYTKYTMIGGFIGVDFLYDNFDLLDRVSIYPGLDAFTLLINEMYNFTTPYSFGNSELSHSWLGGRVRGNLDYEISTSALLNLTLGLSIYRNSNERLDNYFEINLGFSFFLY